MNDSPPVPSSATEAVGVFQPDIIIRTALVAALEDMRANPWLLDFAFASLARDELTRNVYGPKEVARAKEWFLSTKIDVMLGVRPADGAPPAVCITLHLMSSNEVENTLADVHHTTREELEATWAPITPRFDPVSYSALTGVMKVPTNIASQLNLSTSMAVIDRTGSSYQIEEMLTDDSFRLARGTVADFSSCYIKPSIPPYVAALEGAMFEESYAIGCHAMGEPVYCTYLHSIVTFALLRYRASLLEQRGFGRSMISSSDFKVDEIDAPENYFTRYINLSGKVQFVWPAMVSRRILSTEGVVLIEDLAHATVEDASIATIDDLSWVGEEDSLSTRLRG